MSSLTLGELKSLVDAVVDDAQAKGFDIFELEVYGQDYLHTPLSNEIVFMELYDYLGHYRVRAMLE